MVERQKTAWCRNLLVYKIIFYLPKNEKFVTLYLRTVPFSFAPLEAIVTNQTTVSLAELIALFYDEYYAIYGDEELASVAAAATINDILAERASARTAEKQAAAA